MSFEKLNAINVSDKVKFKNGLAYLSWAWAWGEFKKVYPRASYKIYEDEKGRIYHTDGITAWVKVSATVPADSNGDSLENIEYLPVMDFKNKSLPVDKVTSVDANKAIQRALTKAIARHGLGLYVYAGEDLPEEVKKENDKRREMLNEFWSKMKSWDADKIKRFKETYEIKDQHEVNNLTEKELDELLLIADTFQ